MPNRATAQKTGKKTWAPATKLATFGKEPGINYRWCDKDPQNIERKLAEGWEFVNDTAHKSIETDTDSVSQDDLSGAKQYRELVLMAMPTEMADARAEYFGDQNEKSMRSLKRQLDNEVKAGGDAKTHGKIVIE